MFGVFLTVFEVFDCICSCLVLLILYSSFIVGASLNDQNQYGIRPLHWTAKHGNLEVTQLLLQKGDFSLFVEFMNGPHKYYRVI